MSRFLRERGAAILWVMFALGPARADTVVISANRDTMLVANQETFSNGSGQHFCVGMTGEPGLRRGLIRFDVASFVPAGSTIDSVQLELYVNSAAPAAGGTFDLHAVLAAWGEGGSDAPGGECTGTPALLNDATWRYRVYDPLDETGSPQWVTLGGEFDATPSATTVLDGSSGYKAWSSAQMAADVQFWLDEGPSNHGWLLKRREETGNGNALRFSSRQSTSSGQFPRLTVNYTPSSGSAACCTSGQVCQKKTAAACSAIGGQFLGSGSVCIPNPCPPDPVGACCASDGSCSEATLTACGAASGAYQGDGTSCGSLSCPIVLEPFVDALPIPGLAQPVAGVPGGAATYEIAMREVQQPLHRDLAPTTVWGYGTAASGTATYPGPTIEAAANQPVTVAWINDLRDTSVPGMPKPPRVDHYLDVPGTDPEPACHIHGAQDLPKTVVHLHGAHVPAASDGYPEDAYLPGSQLVYTYPNAQLPATLWYHDHALGITRLNVYMGLAGFYLIRDASEQGLALPAGEFELPLAIQDRTFGEGGRLIYPSHWEHLLFGDTILVNGKVWPYHPVKQGKYRLRLLNGCTSRTLTLALDRLDQPGAPDLQLTQIGTDGGLLAQPLALDALTLAPAERADVVVDFAGLPEGTEVVLTNSAPAPYPGTPGAGVVPDVMKFIVQSEPGHTTALPAVLRPLETLDALDAIRTRDFVLDFEPDACGMVWKINGMHWDDLVEFPQLGTIEIWRFVNQRTVMHPMHMHLVMFQVLDRTPIGGGMPLPPRPDEAGWKDTVRVDAETVTRVIARFESYAGKFPYHCHILEHEDHAMMRQFQTVEAPQLDVQRAGLAWSAQPGAVGYDVVRGDLDALRTSGGSFALAAVTQVCVANDEPGTSWTDATEPPAGQGLWYLMRVVDPGGSGTYDTGAPSQVDFRDDEVAASGNDCP